MGVSGAYVHTYDSRWRMAIPFPTRTIGETAEQQRERATAEERCRSLGTDVYLWVCALRFGLSLCLVLCSVMAYVSRIGVLSHWLWYVRRGTA